MASKLVQEVTQDFCCCSICHEPYNQPKVLPCLHSYCKHCLDSHIKAQAKGGIFRCPMCQEDTAVPEKGATGFQDNFFLAGLTEKLVPVAHKCQVCVMDNTETSATSKCLDCDEYLCKECARKHVLYKMFRTHTVLTLEQLQGGDYEVEIKSKKKVLCQKHNDEELKYYCKKCEIPICRDCKAVEHDDHKCSTIDDAFDMVEPNVQEDVNELQAQLPFYTEMTGTLNKDLENLEQNDNKINDDIEETAQRLHRFIDKRKNELKQEASKQTAIQRKKVEACKEEVQLTTSVIKTTSEFANKILAHGQKAEVLLLRHQITSRLQELKSKPPINLTKEMKLEFKHNSDTEKHLAHEDGFGVLSTIEINRKQRLLYQPLYRGKPKIKDTPELTLQFNTGITYPYGIAVTASSEMWITGLSTSIYTYDKAGNFLHKCGNFSEAFNALPLPDGKVIVSDWKAGQVSIMSGNTIISQISMPKCYGLAINSKNEIAVACSNEKHVTILKPDLTIIKTIHQHNGQNLFVWPWFVAYTSQDNLVVSDSNGHKITVLSPSGVPLFTYGTYGSGDEQLKNPAGVCVDSYDNIIIADQNNYRIHCLSSDGKLMKHLVTQNDGLNLPFGVTINNNGELVVTQYGGVYVSVYKYLE